jgi:hypothetical protein
MLRKHLINLIEAMTEKKISESMQRTGPEQKVVSLMLRKHLINLRSCERERIIENWHKFPSDIMAWHGGGQSAKNECL